MKTRVKPQVQLYLEGYTAFPSLIMFIKSCQNISSSSQDILIEQLFKCPNESRSSTNLLLEPPF